MQQGIRQFLIYNTFVLVSYMSQPVRQTLV